MNLMNLQHSRATLNLSGLTATSRCSRDTGVGELNWLSPTKLSRINKSGAWAYSLFSASLTAFLESFANVFPSSTLKLIELLRYVQYLFGENFTLPSTPLLRHKLEKWRKEEKYQWLKRIGHEECKDAEANYGDGWAFVFVALRPSLIAWAFFRNEVQRSWMDRTKLIRNHNCTSFSNFFLWNFKQFFTHKLVTCE